MTIMYTECITGNALKFDIGKLRTLGDNETIEVEVDAPRPYVLNVPAHYVRGCIGAYGMFTAPYGG